MNSSPSPPIFRTSDVIIIGCGFSGVSAAFHLKKSFPQIKISIIEARDRVGGRAYSASFQNERLDLGGQWIGPEHVKVYEFIKLLNLRTSPQPAFGKGLFYKDGKISTFTKNESIPEDGYSESDFQEYRKLIKSIDTLAFRDTNKISHKQFFEEDNLSMETFLTTNNVQSPISREIYDTLFTTLLGMEMKEISLSYFLKFLRSGGGFNSLMDSEGGAQEDRVVGGMQQIVEQLIEKYVGSENLFLKEPVTTVKQFPEQHKLYVVTATGKIFEGSYCISSIPLPLQTRILFDPPLPIARQQLCLRSHMGSIIKVIIAYKTPFWRKKGFSGEILSIDGPARLFFDDTQEGGKVPSLVGFICGKHAREYHGKPEIRKAAIIQQLVHLLGHKAADYVDYKDKDWSEEQWSSGCYFGVTSIGVLSCFGYILREPFGMVHFAGTETAEKWLGYFEGAIESGYRASDEVLIKLNSKKLSKL